jgi:hypothetical protein
MIGERCVCSLDVSDWSTSLRLHELSPRNWCLTYVPNEGKQIISGRVHHYANDETMYPYRFRHRFCQTILNDTTHTSIRRRCIPPIE